jgi:hypothetical protein
MRNSREDALPNTAPTNQSMTQQKLPYRRIATRFIMAAKINTRICQRCGKPVQPSADHIRAIHWASSGTLLWHWGCWVALLKQNSEVTARELCAAAADVEVAGEPAEA